LIRIRCFSHYKYPLNEVKSFLATLISLVISYIGSSGERDQKAQYIKVCWADCDRNSVVVFQMGSTRARVLNFCTHKTRELQS